MQRVINPIENSVFFEANYVRDELLRAARLQKAGKFPKTITMCNDFEALAVLTEEVGEVAHEVNETIGRDPDSEYNKRLHIELIQVAAMAIGWAIAVRDRGGVPL